MGTQPTLLQKLRDRTEGDILQVKYMSIFIGSSYRQGHCNVCMCVCGCGWVGSRKGMEKGDRGQTTGTEQINGTELDIHMRVYTLDWISSLFITSLPLS